MSTKSEVSAGYAEILRKIHGEKKWEGPARTLLSGTQRKGSIGEMVKKRIIADGGQAVSLRAETDVREPIEIKRSYNSLVMCHGVTHMDWFEEIDCGTAKELFDVNLYGSFNLAQAFVQKTLNLPYRKKIISIGSMAYKAVLNGSAAYCASKAGLAHLIRCLAWELAPKGYDVYIIHPSNVDGAPMAEDTIQGLMRYRGMSRGEAENYWGDNYIRGRSLTTEEIADMVSYILNGKSEYLAGSQIELAGGQR